MLLARFSASSMHYPNASLWEYLTSVVVRLFKIISYRSTVYHIGGRLSSMRVEVYVYIYSLWIT